MLGVRIQTIKRCSTPARVRTTMFDRRLGIGCRNPGKREDMQETKGSDHLLNFDCTLRAGIIFLDMNLGQIYMSDISNPLLLGPLLISSGCLALVFHRPCLPHCSLRNCRVPEKVNQVQRQQGQSTCSAPSTPGSTPAPASTSWITACACKWLCSRTNLHALSPLQ